MAFWNAHVTIHWIIHVTWAQTIYHRWFSFVIHHRWVTMCFHADLQQRVPIPVTQQASSFSIFSSHCLLLWIVVYHLLFRIKHEFPIEMFHLIHFFLKIFHIMYLKFMGASNGERDCMQIAELWKWDVFTEYLITIMLKVHKFQGSLETKFLISWGSSCLNKSQSKIMLLRECFPGTERTPETIGGAEPTLLWWLTCFLYELPNIHSYTEAWGTKSLCRWRETHTHFSPVNQTSFFFSTSP